mgnify:CR=1 FL=1
MRAGRDLSAGDVLVVGSTSTTFPAALIVAVARGDGYVTVTARQITDSQWPEDQEPFDFVVHDSEKRLVTVERWAG